MLIDLTVKVPPWLAIPGAPPEPDALEGDDGLPADGDDCDDEVDALPPENRPMTVT